MYPVAQTWQGTLFKVTTPAAFPNGAVFNPTSGRFEQKNNAFWADTKKRRVLYYQLIRYEFFFILYFFGERMSCHAHSNSRSTAFLASLKQSARAPA
jgi:hypothetical protein